MNEKNFYNEWQIPDFIRDDRLLRDDLKRIAAKDGGAGKGYDVKTADLLNVVYGSIFAVRSVVIEAGLERELNISEMQLGTLGLEGIAVLKRAGVLVAVNGHAVRTSTAFAGIVGYDKGVRMDYYSEAHAASANRQQTVMKTDRFILDNYANNRE